MAVGFGIETVPTMFVPSGSGVNLMLKSGTEKPVRELRPVFFGVRLSPSLNVK